MGHKRIDETMIYVHVAENHRREIPACVLGAGQAETDPDRRVLGMLGARGKTVAKAIDEPALARIFQPMHRTMAQLENKVLSVGLGLFIAEARARRVTIAGAGTFG
jgi:hypothetical protein